MFRIDGYLDVTITDAYLAQSRFPAQPGERNERGEMVDVMFSLYLELKDKEGNTDTYDLEFSNRCGIGTRSNSYRTQMSLETLQEIGFNVQTMEEFFMQVVDSPDATNVPNLIGLTCVAKVAKSDKTNKRGEPYYNIKGIYGANKKPAKVDFAAIRARFSNPAPAPAAPQYQAPAAPAPQYQQPAATAAPAPQYQASAAPAAPAAPSNPYARR